MAVWDHPRVWPAFFHRFVCHGCLSERGYLSRPRGFAEKFLLPIVLLRPVRCADCFQRSIRPLSVPVTSTRDSWKTA
jgi:hypothetical protein